MLDFFVCCCSHRGCWTLSTEGKAVLRMEWVEVEPGGRNVATNMIVLRPAGVGLVSYLGLPVLMVLVHGLLVMQRVGTPARVLPMVQTSSTS